MPNSLDNPSRHLPESTGIEMPLKIGPLSLSSNGLGHEQIKHPLEAGKYDQPGCTDKEPESENRKGRVQETCPYLKHTVKLPAVQICESLHFCAS